MCNFTTIVLEKEPYYRVPVNLVSCAFLECDLWVKMLKEFAKMSSFVLGLLATQGLGRHPFSDPNSCSPPAQP